jgi:type I restriction enzyme, S subunit
MIADLRPYAEYKESGLAWLGKVPRHWSLLPNRAIFAEVKDRDHPDEEMLSVTITKGIVKQKALLEDGSKKDSSNLDKSAYKLVQPRDIAYNKMRAWQGAIGASALRGIISPAYVVMRLRSDHDLPSYFHHLYRTPQFAKEAERWSYGITSDMWSLRPEHFKMIYTTEPPPDEQAAIVRFLDWANGRLERAIRAKRKVIALLNEQKQAIIHRAVTRGLDPSVPLKPSGIPWIGDIPQHWEVLALKRVLRRLIDCEHKTAPQVEESAFRVVRTTGVRHGALRMHGTYCTSSDAFRAWTRRGLPEPSDVIFTREAPAGEACIVPYGINVCLGQRTVLMKPNKQRLDPQFLVHMIYAGPPRISITLASQGSTVGHFNMAGIGSLTILLPPKQEQDAIVVEIGEQTAQPDIAISRLEREIELLREYRARLVADVVTGKLDVREAAARLPDEPSHDTGLDDVDPDTDADSVDEEAAA